MHKGLSDGAIALAIAGALGIVVSIGFAMSFFLNYVSLATLVGGMAYILGVVTLALLSAGRSRSWMAWTIQLVAPLPGAVLIYWIISLFGS